MTNIQHNKLTEEHFRLMAMVSPAMMWMTNENGDCSFVNQTWLNFTGNYEIVHISFENQTAANSGLGYLFRFDDVAAKLGEQVGADWVVVGQHSKPRFITDFRKS